MGIIYRREVVSTDSSRTGWGALCEGKPAFSSWSDTEVWLHINCLKMTAVCRVLQTFLPDLKGHYVLVRSDRTTVVTYKLPRQAYLETPFRDVKTPLGVGVSQPVVIEGSTCARHIEPRSSNVPSEEWILHPQTVQKIWEIFGKAEVDLFASKDNSHCPIYFSNSEDALAHDWPNLFLNAFPLDRSDPSGNQTNQGSQTQSPPSGTALEEPALVLRAVSAANSSPMVHSPEAGPLRRTGRSGTPNLSRGLCTSGSQWESIDLHESVLNTISQARAPSMRHLYALKWSVFPAWCTTRGKESTSCDISVILSFLQELFDKDHSPSMLKIYVAAIAAFHAPIARQSVGRNNLVVNFLRGTRRLNLPRAPTVPMWDLPTVLRALKGFPFEPLQSANLKSLSIKNALLLALASVKRLGDWQGLSVSAACLEFGPNDSKVILKPRHGYIPKALYTPFRVQVITLSALLQR